MDKSQVLIDYLKKHCNSQDCVFQNADSAFQFYKANVNKLPSAAITDGYMKIEDGFLRDILKQKDIFDVGKMENGISIIKKEAAFLRADAVLAFVKGGQDMSLYLYGGTRLKTQVAMSLGKDNVTISKGENLYYKDVFSAYLLSPVTKITSVVLNDITEKYKFALDTADSLNLSTLVLTVPYVENTFLENRVAKSVINEIKSHKIYSKIKIVLSVIDELSFVTYNKILQGGNI